MFKLVVLSALVAVAVAKPGLLGGHLEYSALATPIVENHAYAVPSAVSSTYRKDVISKPVVAAYAAPAILTAPAVVATPIVEKTIVAPAAVSSTYRRDVISKPVVAVHAAPAIVATPVVQKTIIAPISSAVSHQSRVDVHSGIAVAAPISYAAHVPSVHAW